MLALEKVFRAPIYPNLHNFKIFLSSGSSSQPTLSPTSAESSAPTIYHSQMPTVVPTRYCSTYDVFIFDINSDHTM